MDTVVKNNVTDHPAKPGVEYGEGEARPDAPAGHEWVRTVEPFVGPDGRDGTREFRAVYRLAKTAAAKAAEHSHWLATAPSLGSHPELTDGQTDDGDRVTVRGNTAAISRTYPLATLHAVRRDGEWHLIGAANGDAVSNSAGKLAYYNNAVRAAQSGKAAVATLAAERSAVAPGHTEFAAYGGQSSPVSREADSRRYGDDGMSDDGRFYRETGPNYHTYYAPPGVSRGIKDRHAAAEETARQGILSRVLPGLTTSKATAKKRGHFAGSDQVAMTQEEWRAMPDEVQSALMRGRETVNSGRRDFHYLIHKAKMGMASAPHTTEAS